MTGEALSRPVVRKVLPGAFASALGDGMSAVAIAWLALKLAPAGSRSLWVGGLAAFFTGAVIWGPWTSLSMAVFQDAAPPAALARARAGKAGKTRRAAGP